MGDAWCPKEEKKATWTRHKYFCSEFSWKDNLTLGRYKVNVLVALVFASWEEFNTLLTDIEIIDSPMCLNLKFQNLTQKVKKKICQSTGNKFHVCNQVNV